MTDSGEICGEIFFPFIHINLVNALMDVVPVSFLLHDSYMAVSDRLDNAISAISGKRASQVSVVRLFGSSSDDTSCCVNVHGYFPRLYIDTVPGMNPESLCALLDLKLSTGDAPLVYNITCHERINFYGYHLGSISVFCIEIFSPSDLPRLADYCTANFTTSTGSPVAVYEVHIPYLLNFLIDYGIQGVTPFFLDASKITLPLQPTSRCLTELSVRVDAILVKKPSADSPSHPVPPPLAGATLVCQTFRALWEEEFARLLPGEPFPYYPEGLVDGLNRPDCVDMPIVEKIPSTTDLATQELARGLEGLPPFTATTVQHSRLTAVQHSLATVMQDTPLATTVQQESREETTQIWVPENLITDEQFFESHTDKEVVQEALAVAPGPISLPNGGCVLRYTQKCSNSNTSSLTGVSQQAGELPSRAFRPLVPSTQEFVHEDQFGQPVCFIETELFETEILSIACIYGDETFFESKINPSFLKNFVDWFSLVDPLVVVSWDATRETIGPILVALQGTGLSLGRSRLGPDVIPVPTRHYSGHRGSHAHLSGRLVLDVWKVLRKDTDLQLATTDFNGVVATVLGETIPSGIVSAAKKTELTRRIFEKTRIMEKSLEMARLLGMDLESTFIRGSQFRVECILIRAARFEGYLLPSSSRAQVRTQPDPADIPLILEPPGAGLITDPVAILDFQSLYPSVIIGYNICYSTCLGGPRAERGLLGCQPYCPPIPCPASIRLPGNTQYVTRGTRVGLLPRICHEILQTRIMIKRAMKSGHKSPARLAQLDARQLTLKLLINVVYGYTTASFTGRMPCVEIADSILLTARKSLETVMVQAGPQVVYGDTDSLFVKIPNGSVGSAFRWGNDLVNLVAETNPWPMKLVMEKVYYPCCLMKKKRYVGRAFDTPTGTPWIDAKGIETIRRDTCPAVAVTVERIVRTVFSMEIFSNIHIVLQNKVIEEFVKLLTGKVPLQFFIFQNQVREKDEYRDPQKLPAAAKVAADTGIETVRGDRVAYVITQGPIGSKLTEQVHPPQTIIDLDDRKRMRLNIEYYLTKQVIPSIQRIFGQIANPAFSWLATAKSLRDNYEDIAPTLMDVAQKKNCLLCKSVTASSIFKNAHVPLFCAHCITHREPQCVFTIQNELSTLEKKCSQIRKICLNCCAGIETDVEKCRNAFHCSVYFERETAKIKLMRAYKRRKELALFKNHFEIS